MIITAIKRDKNHLFKIDTDSGRVLYIDADLYNSSPLSAGDYLSEEQAAQLLRRSDYERARSRALWYLNRSDHTEKALSDKLKRAGFAEESIATVIERLSQVGLVDDRRFALRYAERCMEANISKRGAYAKLMQKGVPKDIIKDTLEETEADENAQIRALIQKKYASKLSSREDISKVYAALIRKGFSFGAVKEELKCYSEEIKYISEET